MIKIDTDPFSKGPTKVQCTVSARVKPRAAASAEIAPCPAAVVSRYLAVTYAVATGISRC